MRVGGVLPLETGSTPDVIGRHVVVMLLTTCSLAKRDHRRKSAYFPRLCIPQRAHRELHFALPVPDWQTWTGWLQ
jgi:hypothetical protein